jgi:hypothetical protein
MPTNNRSPNLTFDHRDDEQRAVVNVPLPRFAISHFISLPFARTPAPNVASLHEPAVLNCVPDLHHCTNTVVRNMRNEESRFSRHTCTARRRQVQRVWSPLAIYLRCYGSHCQSTIEPCMSDALVHTIYADWPTARQTKRQY